MYLKRKIIVKKIKFVKQNIKLLQKKIIMSNLSGRIIQVIGPVIDVSFENNDKMQSFQIFTMPLKLKETTALF